MLFLGLVASTGVIYISEPAMVSVYWFLGYLFLPCRVRPITSKASWNQTQIFTHPIVLHISKITIFLAIYSPAALRTPNEIVPNIC